MLYFSSCAKTSSKHGFACAPTPVGHKLFLNLAMPFNGPWPCSFPRPMAIKQAHGPITWPHKLKPFSAMYFSPKISAISYFAGTRLRVQEKLKHYYSIMTYALKDATQHNNSKTFVALKLLKTTITLNRAISRVGPKPHQNTVLHVQLHQLDANYF